MPPPPYKGSSGRAHAHFSLPAPSGPGLPFGTSLFSLFSSLAVPFLCTVSLLNGVSVGEGPVEATCGYPRWGSPFRGRPAHENTRKISHQKMIHPGPV